MPLQQTVAAATRLAIRSVFAPKIYNDKTFTCIIKWPVPQTMKKLFVSCICTRFVLYLKSILRRFTIQCQVPVCGDNNMNYLLWKHLLLYGRLRTNNHLYHICCWVAFLFHTRKTIQHTVQCTVIHITVTPHERHDVSQGNVTVYHTRCSGQKQSEHQGYALLVEKGNHQGLKI